MKLLAHITLFSLLVLTSCKTSQNVSSQSPAKTASIMPPGAIVQSPKPNVVAAPVRTITLVWNPNYTVAGEATEIFESTDLTIPVSEWPAVFEGATNRCSLPMTGAREFFIAANDVTN